MFSPTIHLYHGDISYALSIFYLIFYFISKYTHYYSWQPSNPNLCHCYLMVILISPHNTFIFFNSIIAPCEGVHPGMSHTIPISATSNMSITVFHVQMGHANFISQYRWQSHSYLCSLKLRVILQTVIVGTLLTTKCTYFLPVTWYCKKVIYQYYFVGYR